MRKLDHLENNSTVLARLKAGPVDHAGDGSLFTRLLDQLPVSLTSDFKDTAGRSAPEADAQEPAPQIIPPDTPEIS